MRSGFISLSILVLCNFLATGFALEHCSSLSCIHATITTINRINPKVNPCDDFYEYACGSFLEKTHPPDDKNVVDSLSLTSEKLTEQLLTLLTKPLSVTEPNLHKIAKRVYRSCMNIGEIFLFVCIF